MHTRKCKISNKGCSSFIIKSAILRKNKKIMIHKESKNAIMLMLR